MIPSRWNEEQNQWVYERGCYTCGKVAYNEEKRLIALQLSGLTPEEANLTLDTFRVSAQNQEAYDAAKRLSLGDAVNLFLNGSAGRGKSHLAIGVVLRRMLAGRARFMPVTKALMEVRSNLRDVSEDEWIDKVLTSEVLVLDDFGANKLTDWNLSFLDCLVDEWYRQRKTGLIVTSNFSLKEISERISDRIASRLAQICEVHELKGKDWRLT